MSPYFQSQRAALFGIGLRRKQHKLPSPACWKQFKRSSLHASDRALKVYDMCTSDQKIHLGWLALLNKNFQENMVKPTEEESVAKNKTVLFLKVQIKLLLFSLAGLRKEKSNFWHPGAGLPFTARLCRCPVGHRQSHRTQTSDKVTVQPTKYQTSPLSASRRDRRCLIH